MKHCFIILFSLLAFSSYGQNYPFAKEFKDGVVFFNDSLKKTGQLKWFPHQNEKLKFREAEKGEIKKYAPEDILGFSVDTLKFVSLYDLELYADDYALLGKRSKVKHMFGQVLDIGKFNIYFVLKAGYNAISGAIQTYPNFVFEKVQDNNSVMTSYPFAIRMRDKKYEEAKEGLYEMFKDYPEVVERLKAYRQQDDFFKIIDLIKGINRQ